MAIPGGVYRRRQEAAERDHLQLVGPLWCAAYSDRTADGGGWRTEAETSADQRRRSRAHRAVGQQRGGAGIIGLGVAGPDQGGQGAPAGAVRRGALKGAPGGP